MMKISSLTREQLIKVLVQHRSINSALISLNVNANGSGAYKSFKATCLRLEVDPEDFLDKTIPWKRGSRRKFTLKEILVENSDYKAMSRLKNILIRKGVLTDKCYECGITDWNGKPISLHLDHKNGVNNDNRKRNLHILCPNCHSQTPSYGGRNCKGHIRSEYSIGKNGKRMRVQGKCDCGNVKLRSSPSCAACFHKRNRKVKNPPSKKELKLLIDKMPYTHIGKKYSVSDNAVRAWARKYGLI